jgi:hypothetical protein
VPLLESDFLDKFIAWSKEPVSRAKAVWITRNRQRLLKAFPPGERAFCRIIDKFQSRLTPSGKTVLHYHRQKPFVVTPEFVFYGDFYFKAFKYLVEIDGDTHIGRAAKSKDTWRSEMLSSHGIVVKRFTNEEVVGRNFREIEKDFLDGIFSLPGHARLKVTLHKAVSRAYAQNPHIYSCGVSVP